MSQINYKRVDEAIDCRRLLDSTSAQQIKNNNDNKVEDNAQEVSLVPLIRKPQIRRNMRTNIKLHNAKFSSLVLVSGAVLVALVASTSILLTVAEVDSSLAASQVSSASASLKDPSISSVAAARPPTQPSVDRQLDAPLTSGQRQSSTSTTTTATTSTATTASAPHKASPSQPKPIKPTLTSQKKALLASQQNYDKYQLKATNSQQNNGSPSTAAATTAVAAAASGGSGSASASQAASATSESSSSSSSSSSSASMDEKDKSATGAGYKKSGLAAQQAQNKPRATLSLLKKLLPSFITSAGPMAAAAATAALVSSDKHQQSSNSRSAPISGDSPVLSRASQRLLNMLASRKGGAVPDHAPFFVRPKPASDRQAGALGSIASGLLSNPLSLGLLFSAPLIPSLLLTPLAIAGLSPAMSAINNFFGDDDEPASSPSPLMSALGSSPLASIINSATGNTPTQASGDSGSSSGGGGGSSAPSSFAMQAFQSLLAGGPSSTTERPLFNPGMFASQGIQNAAGSLAAGALASTAGSSGSSSPSSSSSPIRSFFGGGGSGSGGSGGSSLMQAAASMISPSFAAPPSQAGGSSALSSTGGAGSGSSDSDDGPGLMQMASDVFDKVAAYMGSPSDASKDVGQASGANSQASSPLSALVGLSSLSPFQLSSLLAPTPLGGAASAHSSHSTSSHGPQQKVGFISTLRNIYELFSSSFLRRQEVGDSNECQQRLVCELHQRAMNSKLFRRSVQANLMELSQLDKSMIEQVRSGAQARVDAETKAMLNDFLKATNNFKQGRELVNCSKMFPKCSRAMLLSAANAHLVDPVNGRAIGKFSTLMKKMKFKSAQQHTNQWKLRKTNKQIPMPMAVPSLQSQPMDYMQVVPMPAAKSTGGPQSQLTPADSLKLVQQIMLMQQQQQQQSQAPSQTQAQLSQVHNSQQSQDVQQVQMQQQQQQYNRLQPPSYSQAVAASNGNSYQTNGAYYNSMPVAGAVTTYSDATGPTGSGAIYSYTESPHSLASMDQSNIAMSTSSLSTGTSQSPQAQMMQSMSQYNPSADPNVAYFGNVATNQQQQQQQQQQQPMDLPVAQQQQQQQVGSTSMDTSNKQQRVAMSAPQKVA